MQHSWVQIKMLEKPSDYLNRLYVMLEKAVTGGGVLAESSPKKLLRQFCRVCWDQATLIELQFEEKKANPPSFPELLLLLRKQEDRRQRKINRMKKHLGSAKAMSHMQTVYGLPQWEEELEEAEPIANQKAVKKHLTETQRLAQEVAELKKQLALRAVEPQKVNNPNGGDSNTVRGNCMATDATSHRTNKNTPDMPRAWFCFRCGEDGNIAAQCLNEPNPAAVRQKNLELRERRERRSGQHQGQPNSPLNH